MIAIDALPMGSPLSTRLFWSVWKTMCPGPDIDLRAAGQDLLLNDHLRALSGAFTFITETRR
jgi:hypothetical protein